MPELETEVVVVGDLVKTRTWIMAGVSIGFMAGVAPASGQDALAQMEQRIENSAVHQRAKAASGGLLKERHHANAAVLYADLAALMKASDAVLLVHIVRNMCGVSPSGQDVITWYHASVLHHWKDNRIGSDVHFTVPGGMIGFADGTRVLSTMDDYHPLLNGHRYVVFLRVSQGQERQVTPGYRLTGDAVQGAFELDNESVHPMYRTDTLRGKYDNVSVPALLNEILAVANVQRVVQYENLPLVPVGNEAPRDLALADGALNLSAARLAEVGLHLPSYMPTVRDLNNYQKRQVEALRDFTIDWDFFPGQPKMVGEPAVRGLPISSDFVLKGQKQITGGMDAGLPVGGALPVVAVGVTSQGEVRGVNANCGPGWITVPPPPPGHPVGDTSLIIVTKATCELLMPDDPEIREIIFFRTKLDVATSQFALEKVAELPLDNQTPPGPAK